MRIADAYFALGLQGSESLDTVEQAYRRLASKWHPDRNPSPEAGLRMTVYNQAIALLRKTIRSSPSRGSSARSPSEPAQPHQETRDRKDPSSFFRSVVGQARDIRRKLKISLYEAAFGCKKELSGTVTDDCATCAGSGVHLSVCPICKGGGSYQSISGLFHCVRCGGEGWLPAGPCRVCDGEKKSHRSREWRVEVTVPAGTLGGGIIVAKGMGCRSMPGLEGNLIITVELLPHDLFTFSDLGQLQLEVPISAWRWVAGGQVVVPTLDGFDTVNIDPGVLSTVIVGKGWPPRRAGLPWGDLGVVLRPQFPTPGYEPKMIEAIEALVAEHENDTLHAWNARMMTWSHPDPEQRHAPSPRRPQKKARR
jgi:molecular chaperone DnaJ